MAIDAQFFIPTVDWPKNPKNNDTFKVEENTFTYSPNNGWQAESAYTGSVLLPNGRMMYIRDGLIQAIVTPNRRR